MDASGGLIGSGHLWEKEAEISIALNGIDLERLVGVGITNAHKSNAKHASYCFRFSLYPTRPLCNHNIGICEKLCIQP